MRSGVQVDTQRVAQCGCDGGYAGNIQRCESWVTCHVLTCDASRWCARGAHQSGGIAGSRVRQRGQWARRRKNSSPLFFVRGVLLSARLGGHEAGARRRGLGVANPRGRLLLLFGLCRGGPWCAWGSSPLRCEAWRSHELSDAGHAHQGPAAATRVRVHLPRRSPWIRGGPVPWAALCSGAAGGWPDYRV